MNDVFHLWIGDGKNLHLLSSVSAKSREALAKGLETFLAAHGFKDETLRYIERRGRKGEAVEITDFDSAKTGNLGRKDDLFRGQVFISGAKASEFLGCRNNQVATELARAKREGKNEATVQGVTFRYLKDSPD